MSERALFVTKIGVIAATVGSAVGLGNIWRFPYMAGENGGGAFLITYVCCVIILGIPLMCAEFIVGRKARSNALWHNIINSYSWLLYGNCQLGC